MDASLRLETPLVFFLKVFCSTGLCLSLKQFSRCCRVPKQALWVAQVMKSATQKGHLAVDVIVTERESTNQKEVLTDSPVKGTY